ncbi:hypothetical protein [Perigonia lusca single nucleopolyhedrovirus]|uniref:Uncharacterized protein n=1 Tax=Perigonia lusca single nucleopolyhedrovirus TaxID=1675865 RepID=A0A0M3WNI8_9ABAC|nr:hypothetical protein [Perigonia lusca single nucleopolyhedrovirus]AKN80681.1 hypothetical protein [Perigonia lusca single nucleopolyhedrovirus]
MNNVAEALELAEKFTHLHMYHNALQCYNLAIHFLNFIEIDNDTVKYMINLKIQMCQQHIVTLTNIIKTQHLTKYSLIK